MTTQTQGKSKRKNKDVTKFSLEEFNNVDAPHGHSVVSLKVTGLDWAKTMADYDQQASESQQIIVPAVPRAQRGPAVDIDSLPNEPPFRVSLFNVPMSADEKDIERFFHQLEIKAVENSKSSTTVEFGSRSDLFDALCKDGNTLKNRIINVCLYGQQPPQNSYNSDRYAGRGGNSSYGDRYGERNQGGFGGPRSNDRYGDRTGGYNRDRNNYGSGGFNRGGGGGYNQQRSGPHGDRFNDRGNYRETRGPYTHGGGEPSSEESNDWRARPNVTRPSPPLSHNSGYRQPYSQSRHEQTHYQQPHHPAPPSSHYPQNQHEPYYPPRHQPSNNSSYQEYSNQGNDRQAPPAPQARTKLVLEKRKTPLNLEDAPRNEAIFGKAKPTSTPYQRMKEVEEKLSAAQISDKKDTKASSSPATSQTGAGSSPPPQQQQQQQQQQPQQQSLPPQSAPAPPRQKRASES